MITNMASIQVTLCSASIGILASVIYMYTNTTNDLTRTSSDTAILKIQLFRGGMTFLAVLALGFLSLLNSGMRPKWMAITKWLYNSPFYCSGTIHKTNEELYIASLVCWPICFAYFVPLFIACMIDCIIAASAFFLVSSFFCLFGVANFITNTIQNIVARVKIKKVNYKEFLLYAYLR